MFYILSGLPIIVVGLGFIDQYWLLLTFALLCVPSLVGILIVVLAFINTFLIGERPLNGLGFMFKHELSINRRVQNAFFHIVICIGAISLTSEGNLRNAFIVQSVLIVNFHYMIYTLYKHRDTMNNR